MPITENGRYSRNRWLFGVIAVGLGVGALLIAFLVIGKGGGDGFSEADLAALGVIASPIVAMVSAYFGITATAAASKEAIDATTAASKEAIDATRIAGAEAADLVSGMTNVGQRIEPPDPASADHGEGSATP